MARRVFISYQHNDLEWAKKFSKLKWEEHVGFEFYDRNMFNPVNSENPDYVKRKIREQMNGTSVTTILIGEKTSSSEWVDFEINESMKRKNGIMGIRLPGHKNAEIPDGLKNKNARIVDWEPETFSDEVEISALIAGRKPQKPPVYSRAVTGACGRAN